MSAQNNGSGASDFVSGLQDAVRQNPVSAALVGMGLLWMFTGGNRLSTAAAFFPAVAKGAAAGAADGLLRTAGVVSAAGEGVKSLGERFVDGVRDTLSEATAATGDAATRSVEGVKSVAAQSAAQLRSTTAEIGAADYGVGQLQQNLKQTFERQPLLLGAIGLAIGAGMASAFAATQFEKDAVGFSVCSITLPDPDQRCGGSSQVLRHYSRFSQAAAENGESRILVGYHFRKAVEDGIVHGTKIGNRAVSLFLRRSR